MTLGERIKKIRKEKDLTQRDFGTRIGTTQNAIANYEIGHRNPSSAVIDNICKTFNISEVWLRTGEGGMFVPQSKENELAAAVERLITGESAEFKRRLVCALSTLKEEHWILLEQKLKEIVGMREASAEITVKSPQEMTREEIHAEIDRQLDEEKKQKESWSAYGRAKSGTASG